MNGEKIVQILSSDPYVKKNLLGYGTPDLPILPSKKKPSVFILNTDHSEGPGEHWCMAYFQKSGICEFYDSFGYPPHVYGFNTEFDRHATQVLYSAKQVQGWDSSACAYYCIYFAMKRCRGVSMQAILNTFSSVNFKRNDDIVRKCVMQFGDVYKLESL